MVPQCTLLFKSIGLLYRVFKRKQNLNYNTPGGKLNRGMSVVDTVEILKGSELSDDEYFKAGVLGWSVELVSCHLCYRIFTFLTGSSSCKPTSSSQMI